MTAADRKPSSVLGHVVAATVGVSRGAPDVPDERGELLRQRVLEEPDGMDVAPDRQQAGVDPLGELRDLRRDLLRVVLPT